MRWFAGLLRRWADRWDPPQEHQLEVPTDIAVLYQLELEESIGPTPSPISATIDESTAPEHGAPWNINRLYL